MDTLPTDYTLPPFVHTLGSMLDAKPVIRALIYGDPGVGKTSLVGSANEVPEMCPVLYVDIESGKLTLKRYPDMRAVAVTDWDRELKPTIEWFAGGKHPFKTLIVDNLTILYRIVMQWVLSNSNSKDMDVPGLQDWQRASNRFLRLISVLNYLPYNVLCTSFSQDVRDERTGIITRKPSLPGKLADDIAGYFDLVGFLYVQSVGDSNQRCLLTDASAGYVAKDRSQKLPRLLQNPSMQSIYSAYFA